MILSASLSAAASAAVSTSSTALGVAVTRVVRPPLCALSSHVGVLVPGNGGAYKPRLAMYCTTPSGTRYQTGSPSPTLARHSVDEMDSAGISTRLTFPSGRPDVDS